MLQTPIEVSGTALVALSNLVTAEDNKSKMLATAELLAELGLISNTPRRKIQVVWL